MQKRLDLVEQDIEKGRFLVAKLNCQGCHTLDGKTGQIRVVTEDPGAAPPVLDGEGAKVREKWLHEFLKSPTVIRPWLTYRMPTFGLSEEELRTLVFYFHHLAGQKMTFGESDIPESDPESLAAGKTLFESFQCVKCHQVTQDNAAMGSSFLAPDLHLTKSRLKPEWVRGWLRDPQVLQEGTMMPTFFSDGQSPMADILGGDAEKQIQAIRDYLYRYESSSGPNDDNKKAVAK
jgi:cytochrome c2